MIKSVLLAVALALALAACGKSGPSNSPGGDTLAGPDAGMVKVFIKKNTIIVDQEPNLHVGETGTISIRWHLVGSGWAFVAPSDPKKMIVPAPGGNATPLADENCVLVEPMSGNTQDIQCTYTQSPGKYVYAFSVKDAGGTTLTTDPSIRN